MRERGAIEDVVQTVQPDRVYHLAGLSHTQHARTAPRKTYRVNFTGTLNVLEALAELDPLPPTLLAGSSASYGNSARSNEPLRETDPLRPINPYGVSKAAMDLLGEQWATDHNWRIVRTRSFPHTGPGQRSRFFCSQVARDIVEIERGAQPTLSVGNIDVERDYLDVRDVVEAYWMLLNEAVPAGPYNVCRGKVVALRRIISLMEKGADTSFQVRREPDRERGDEIQRISGDNSKLMERTGWEPTYDLSETCSDLLGFWRRRLG